MTKGCARTLAAACWAAFLAAGPAARAQEAAAGDTLAGSPDIASVGKIGRMHDHLRRAAERHSLYTESADLYGEYSAFKARSAKGSGLSWAMDLSYLQQWGRPNGGSPAGQWLATPSIDWTLFDSHAVGSGSVQLAYTAVRYGTQQNAADVQDQLGMITPLNDNPLRQNVFAQLTYTQTLPGDRLSVSVGQYPFYNFDGNQYLNNQQQNFNNYVLAQNGSSTYPIAGLGAYLQLNATSSVQFAAGFQSAGNITGATLSTRDFGDGGYAWFGYAQWSPSLSGLGAARYSITYYAVPGVPAQSPGSRGWSVNAVHNLNDTWAIFARANQADNYVTPIRASWALGAAINNPLGRSATDQIGLAFGYSDAAPPPTNPVGARNEKVIEAYWNRTFAKGVLLSPDVQYIRDPALAPARASAWVLALRATFLF